MTSEVYVFFKTTSTYRPIGLLTCLGNAGFVFRYGKRYLEDPASFSIDPVRLPLRPDEYFSPILFNVFQDACPDAWGKKLIGLSRGRRGAGDLTDFEALTAVHSSDRMGALAFGPTPKQPESMSVWGKPEEHYSSMEDIERLAQAVKEAESGKKVSSSEFLKAFYTSLSLGGARPKALFSREGVLWIAKFPKHGDGWDEPRIEYGTLLLAEKCGIRIPEVHCLNTSLGTVLLVKRFDREKGGARHIISGFTLGDLREDGDWGSYQNMAEQARRLGSVVDGKEIFRRMVFNAACNNIDDHPRNHAFFVNDKGLSITPAFDVLPSLTVYTQRELALGCGTKGRSATAENLLSDVAPFGVSLPEAKGILDKTMRTVSMWEEHFDALGIGEHERTLLAERFRLEESKDR